MRRKASKYGAFLLVLGTSLFWSTPAQAAYTGNVQITCATSTGQQRTNTVGWDNSNSFFMGKGNIAQFYCEGGYAGGQYTIFVSTSIAGSDLLYYNGVVPTPTPSPSPSTSPSPEPSPTPTVEASPSPSPSPSDGATVSSQDTQTSTVQNQPTIAASDSQTVLSSDTQTVVTESSTQTNQSETQTPTQEQPSQSIPLPTPVPVVEPQPVAVPEPQPAPQPQPEIVPEPVPAEPLPAEEPSPTQEEVDSPVPPVPDIPEEQSEPNPEPSPEPTVEPELTSESDIAQEPPVKEGTITLANGVVLEAQVAQALEVLNNPAELLADIFTDPGQVLLALGNVGADMSPEARQKSKDAVVQAVIVGSIVSQAAGAAYRRKP